MRRIILVPALAVTLFSCGKKSSGSPETPVTAGVTPSAPVPSPTPIPVALVDQVAKLDREGVLPKLDRSDSLVGPDANKDGIRDDVETYIESLPLTVEQKKAARQTAKALQKTVLVDASDENAVSAVRVEGTEARNCLYSTFPKKEARSATSLSRSLTAVTLNTKARTQAFLRYDSALSGKSWRLPDRNTCKE